MIIQHWRTKGGKHEIQVEEIHSCNGVYYRANSMTNGVVNSTCIRHDKNDVLIAAASAVKLSATIDNINYICTYDQGEVHGV